MAVKLPSVDTMGERPTPRSGAGVATYRVDESGETAGRATMALGGALVQEGDQIMALAKIEQEKIDTTKVEDAWNQYKNKALDLTVGEKGVLNTKGADAVNGNILNMATATLTDSRRMIMQGLGTDEQKKRFNQRADVTDLQTKHQVLNHLVSQQAEYTKTVFNGSQAAATAQIVAAPADQNIFNGVKDTLLAQADHYLKSNGITDQNTIDETKRKLTDSLWTTRIDTLLYSQPVLADAMLRAHEKEISNPETRLLLQNKTRSAALVVNASIEAQKAIDEVRADMPAPAAAPTPRPADPSRGVEVGGTPGSGPRSVQNNNPGNIVKSSIKWEGAVDGKDPKFVTFATYEDGRRAMEKNLLAYQSRGLDTVAAIINRWAPASENGAASTNNYVAAVAKAAGVAPDAKIDLKDPATMQKVANAIEQFESGGAPYRMTTVGNQQPQPLPPNTNGLPNSRDIAAQLPIILAKVETTADRLYGKDPYNPDRAAFVARMQAEVQSKLSRDVQQLNAIQREAQGKVLDAVMGMNNPPTVPGLTPVGGQQPARAMLTSLSQIQADPNLARSYMLMDPQAQLAVNNLLDRNLSANDKGDVQLYRDLFNRIHLEPGAPGKIDFYQQIVDPNVANRLSMSQIQQLRAELDRNETPGGRSLNQMRRAADTNVAAFFKTTPMFTAQPDRQIAATMRWNEEAGKKIDEYVKAGKDVRPLFMVDSKDSIVSPAYLQTFINSTPAQGLATGAAAVAGGSQAPLAGAPPAVQPATITTREQLDAWFQTLPPGVATFTGTDGKVRAVPPRAAATGGTTPPNYGPRVDGTPKGNGFFGPLPTKTGEVATEISIGVNIDGKAREIPALVPTLTRPEIDSLLAGDKPSKAIVDKAVAHAQARIAQGRSPFAEPNDQVTMTDTGKIAEKPVLATPPAAEVTVEDFTVVDKPTTVRGQIAAVRKARERIAEIRKLGAQGPQYQIGGPLVSLARGATAVGDAILAGPAALGRAAQQAIPTELEAVYAGFDAIKKAKRVNMQDEDILTEVLRYGLLQPGDQALAKGLLAKIEAKK